MAIFVKHIGCSRCGSSDANAVYSNGSEYCFSCGAVNSADRPAWKDEAEEEEVVRVPDDATTQFPEVVVNWIKPTTVTIEELIKHGYFFTETGGGRLGRVLASGLRFDCSLPYRSHQGLGGSANGVTAIEYRNLSQDSEKDRRESHRAKARFLGSKEEARAQSGYHLLQHSGRIVLVEDSLSSIRVGRYFCSEPLFGSSVSNNKLSRMIEGATEVIVWLDSDKYRSAVDIASRVASLGTKARAVVTESDPKYVDNIEEVLQ